MRLAPAGDTREQTSIEEVSRLVALRPCHAPWARPRVLACLRHAVAARESLRVMGDSRRVPPKLIPPAAKGLTPSQVSSW